MLSLLSPPKPFLLKPLSPKLHHRRQRLTLTCSSSRIPPSPAPAPPGQVYQPFRPPPSPLPSKYRSLNPAQRLDILRDRLGLWHEYAPLISSLSHDGFTPPSIEEVTGITGVHQNRLAVASRVRDSLLQSADFDQDLLPFFDHPSGADLLYELRLVNTSQRSAAARYLVEANLDSKTAQDLARAIKDFPRRRGDYGWESFLVSSPADCLAFTYFRMSREAIAVPDKLSALEKAIEIAETEVAKARISQEIERVAGKGDGKSEEDEEIAAVAKLPVVRLRYGEVSEAESVVLLPVCKWMEGVKGVRDAPGICKGEGELGVMASEKGWGRWVVLPGWPPVLGLGGEGGVAVEFGDARVLPWRVNRWEKEEGVIVVVDRKQKQVGENDDGFWLVSEDEEKMEVVRGGKVGEKEVLGALVLVVRPPKEEEDDQIADEDWD